MLDRFDSPSWNPRLDPVKKPISRDFFEIFYDDEGNPCWIRGYYTVDVNGELLDYNFSPELPGIRDQVLEFIYKSHGG